MAEKMIGQAAGRKGLTKAQAMTIMVIGGLMLGLPMIIPTEQGSTSHTVKIVVGILGVVVICVGAYLRPMPAQGKAV